MQTDQPREPQTYTDEFMAEYVRNHRCHSALRDVSIADWDRGVRVIQTNAAVAEEPTTIALPDDPAQDPQLGASGYPHEQELRRIREWPWEGGFRSLMAYIRDRWRYADAGYWEQQGDRFAISTGGWSGNESIIGALEQNRMFSMLCAWSWRRGGHYVYDVREWSEGPDGKRVLVRDPATPAIEAEAAADALRERDEAVRLLEEAVNALEWCDSRYRQTLAGKSVRDVAEMRAYIGRTLSDARTFLRRFEGGSG